MQVEVARAWAWGRVSWCRRQVGPARQLRNSLLYFIINKLTDWRWAAARGPCLVPRLTRLIFSTDQPRFRGSPFVGSQEFPPPAGAKAVKIHVFTSEIKVFLKHKIV